MMKSIKSVLLSVSVIAISTTANASLITSTPSLITNGSFESVKYANDNKAIDETSKKKLASFDNTHRKWSVFYALPGWVTSSGKGIELQKNVVTQSQDGSQHVELDSSTRNSNSVMTQSVDSLTVGANYLLEFFYKPRTNTTNDNGINVYWYDEATKFDVNMTSSLVANSTHRVTPNWVKKSVVLTAQSSSMDLSFGAFGKQNTLGGLIDNVSLVQLSSPVVDAIPEPSIFALSLLGFGLLVRRHNKKTCKNI